MKSKFFFVNSVFSITLASAFALSFTGATSAKASPAEPTLVPTARVSHALTSIALTRSNLTVTTPSGFPLSLALTEKVESDCAGRLELVVASTPIHLEVISNQFDACQSQHIVAVGSALIQNGGAIEVASQTPNVRVELIDHRQRRCLDFVPQAAGWEAHIQLEVDQAPLQFDAIGKPEQSLSYRGTLPFYRSQAEHAGLNGLNSAF